VRHFHDSHFRKRSSVSRAAAKTNNSGQVREKLIANLGHIDRLQLKHLEAMIDGLDRALGRAPGDARHHRVRQRAFLTHQSDTTLVSLALLF
jgi:hypothetical protein